jgi:hypothetical protein
VSIADGQRPSSRRQQWALAVVVVHQPDQRERHDRAPPNAVPCSPETPSFRVPMGQPAVTIDSEWYQAANNGTGPRPSRNTTEPGYGCGLSLGITVFLTSSQPGRTRASCCSTHRGRRADGTSARAPLSSELRHCTACPDRILGRGSHLGSTLNPGRAVLTGGVFRRSRSVACIRADASPSEVLAPAIIDYQTRCCQAN